MLSDLQKLTAQAIVNIFETGKVAGEYGSVAVLKGDTGHLSYGRSQASLGSGSLYALIAKYCSAPGAQCAQDLDAYLAKLHERDTGLDADSELKAILQRAGQDPIMCHVQDSVFDRNYWNPAFAASTALQITTALGTRVVYDGFIQGAFLHDKVIQAVGSPGTDVQEQEWIARYVQLRRNWLATNPNAALHSTVYRMDAFSEIINQDRWQLELPLTVCEVAVDENWLAGAPPSPRILKLEDPHLTGDDVRAVQQALAAAGVVCEVDGDFSSGTDATVRAFQRQHGLAVDGIVGSDTRNALGTLSAAAGQ